MRGCQDIDPRCALIDEMRSAGGMKFQFESIQYLKWYGTLFPRMSFSVFLQIWPWQTNFVMLGQTTTAPSLAIDAKKAKISLCWLEAFNGNRQGNGC